MKKLPSNVQSHPSHSNAKMILKRLMGDDGILTVEERVYNIFLVIAIPTSFLMAIGNYATDLGLLAVVNLAAYFFINVFFYCI